MKSIMQIMLMEAELPTGAVRPTKRKDGGEYVVARPEKNNNKKNKIGDATTTKK